MAATRFRICSRQEYEVNGEKKTAWPEVGFYIESGDKRYVTLNVIPGTLFHVFPIEKPEQAKSKQNEDSLY